MRLFRAAGVVCAVALLLTATACGGAKEEAAQEAPQAAAGAASDTAAPAAVPAGGMENLAKSMEAAGRGLAAIGGGEFKPVEPVSFRELQTFFPDFDGWERGQPEGEKMTAPVSYSQSEVEYTSGESRLTARIADSGFNQVIFAPFMMFMVQGYEKESSRGYEKGVTVAGAPGFEKWDSEEKSGELTLVVGKRFLVELKARGVADNSVLHEMAAKIDMNRLAGLK